MLFFKKKEKITFSLVDIGLKADVHSHILPSVDDGSPDAVESVKILTELHRLGVRKCIFTPHVSRSMFPNTADGLRHRFETFMPAVPEELRSDMQFHLASEYMVDEFFGDLTDRLYWPDGRILIEMSYYQRSREIKETVFNLRMEGRQPVLAHPERYPYLNIHRSRMVQLKNQGVYFQTNVLSLGGFYGDEAKKRAYQMIERGWVEFMGTDTHNTMYAQALVDLSHDRKVEKILEKYEFMNKTL